MNQAMTGGENTRLIVLISVVATIGGFLFGFDSGVINGTVDGLQQAFGSTKAGLGFEVASMLLGCAVGAFSAGRLADSLGRRNVLIISAVLFLLSASRPALKAPTAQPSSIEATSKPRPALVEPNACCRPSTVPLMTPLSKPNRNPPIVATTLINTISRVFSPPVIV